MGRSPSHSLGDLVAASHMLSSPPLPSPLPPPSLATPPKPALPGPRAADAAAVAAAAAPSRSRRAARSTSRHAAPISAGTRRAGPGWERPGLV